MKPGTRIGVYEILAVLGAGGMGEVYRARDTRLDRDVALKILPESFASDPDRRMRFEREAKTLAALNHANIAAIYGFEEGVGTDFGPADAQTSPKVIPTPLRALVMELVEGEDLAERLARGPIPLDEALPLARQVAEALEAAHDAGIIHRDLKPANIKVRSDGTVKVLDFGLAKALEPTGAASSPDATHSPAITSPALTARGVILGTAAYMSPEQARGKAVDRRTDIWAFGAVLFEMLTGARLFPGETLSDTVAAVLTREFDWSQLPAATPARVRRLLQRCLDRDARRRLQAIGEARVVLEDPGPPVEQGAAATSTGHLGRWMIAAVAGSVTLFAAGWLLRPAGRGSDGPVRKVDLSIDRLAVSQGRVPAISPDGTRVAYIAGGELRVRRLDELDSIALAAGDDILYVSWSPDSRQLAYVRQGRAWRVSSEGGPSTELGAVSPDLSGSGGSAWTSDGQVVFAGSDTVGLWAIPAGGGTGRDLLPLDRDAEADFHEIAALPDGRGLIFTVHRKSRLPDMIAIVSGGTRRTLLELEGESIRHPTYSPTGHIVYARETTNPGLWAVPFSIDRLETTGPPFLAVPGGYAPTVSRDGTLCLIRSDDTPLELVRVSRAGTVELVAELTGTRSSMLWGGPTNTGYQSWGGVSLSPDGGRVATSVGFSPGQLSVYDLGRGSQSNVASGTFPSRAVWTRDGERLVYASSREARAWNLWSRRADGAGDEERYSTSDEVQLPSAISPDGTTLVFSEGSGPSGNFFKMSAVAGSRATPLFPRRVWGLTASFSPDGRFLVHESPESGRAEVYVRPFPEGDQRLQVSTDGGGEPVWAQNGEIFYVNGGSSIAAVSVTTEGGALSATKPTVLFQTGGPTGLAPVFDVTPDGQTFFMLRARGREHISLILNWFQELEGSQAAGNSGDRP